MRIRFLFQRALLGFCLCLFALSFSYTSSSNFFILSQILSLNYLKKKKKLNNVFNQCFWPTEITVVVVLKYFRIVPQVLLVLGVVWIAISKLSFVLNIHFIWKFKFLHSTLIYFKMKFSKIITSLFSKRPF